MKYIITLLLFFGFLHDANAQVEHVSNQTALATAKMAGACGILDSMITLQAQTKIEGGNLFVTRFWEAEAARLGMTVKEMSDVCDKAILNYEAMWVDSGKDNE